jgi:hypothetical protein
MPELHDFNDSIRMIDPIINQVRLAPKTEYTGALPVNGSHFRELADQF